MNKLGRNSGYLTVHLKLSAEQQKAYFSKATKQIKTQKLNKFNKRKQNKTE